MSLVGIVTMALAALLASSTAYTVGKAATVYRVTQRNRQRSVTNRQALREIVRQEGIDVEPADPITGYTQRGDDGAR